jgi:hypothetical protein
MATQDDISKILTAMYCFCIMNGIVCTACQSIIVKSGRDVKASDLFQHEQCNRKVHPIRPVDLATEKKILESVCASFYKYVDSVVKAIVSAWNNNGDMEKVVLRHIGIQKAYHYCKDKTCNKLVFDKMHHKNKSHLSKCRGVGSGYASKYNVNGKVVPGTFTVNNRDDLDKYFGQYFSEQLCNSCIPIQNNVASVPVLLQQEYSGSAPIGFDLIKDDIMEAYGNMIQQFQYARSFPRVFSKNCYEVWINHEARARVQEPKAIVAFWKNIAAKHSVEISSFAKYTIYYKNLSYTRKIYRLMNYNPATKQVNNNYNPKKSYHKCHTLLGVFENTNTNQGKKDRKKDENKDDEKEKELELQIDVGWPFLVMKDVDIDLEELVQINSQLHHKYLPKNETKTASQKGLSLYHTRNGNRVYFNQYIVGTKNPQPEDVMFQNRIVTIFTNMVEQACRDDLQFHKLCEFYRSIPHMKPHLIGSTCCTNIWYSSQTTPYRVHIDKNTVGPTFYFVLEELKEQDGGELTFRHYP